MPLTLGVVIPIYRVERWVARCIASIATQSRWPDQVVLVDDVGGDASVDRAMDAARDAGLPVRLIRHAENRGLSAARNTGLRHLSTELVWFVDSDDRVAPDFARDMVAAFDEDTSLDVAVCRTMRIDENDAPHGIEEPSSGDRTVGGAVLARMLLRGEIRGYACNKVFRRAVLGAAPYPEGQGYEDVTPMLRMALASRNVALRDAPHYEYRVTPDSLSQRFGLHTGDLLRQNEEIPREVRSAAPSMGSDADAWREALLRFRYDQVLLPAANMACRHRERRDRDRALDAVAREVIRDTRSRIRWTDVRDLLRCGARRQSVAAAVLTVSPRLYGAILRRR